ncbi:MAG: histidine kinase [Bacteroidetes bacterium]|nr:histidine kinase [Bacteroidota bacterium]
MHRFGFESTDIGIVRYGFSDGLNATSVYGITYSPNGYIWAHTNIGVYVFNGFQFQRIPQLSGKEMLFANMVNDSLKMVLSFDNTMNLLNTRNISSTRELILPDSMRLQAFAMSALEINGELIIGTSDGRVLFYQEGNWRQIHFPPDKGTPRRIAAIKEFEDDVIYFTTNGSWKIEGNRPSLVRLRDAVIGKPSFRNGGWVATSLGIEEMTPNGLQPRFTNKQLHISSLITQHAWVTNNELWITTQSNGLKIVYVNENKEIEHIETIFENEFFTGITVDDAGAVWVSSLNGGILKFQPWFRSFTDIRTINGSLLQQVVFADVFDEGSKGIVSSRFNSSYTIDITSDNWITQADRNSEYASWINGQELFFSRSTGFDIYNAHEQRYIKRYTGLEFPVVIQPPVKQAVADNDNLLALATPNGAFIIDRVHDLSLLNVPGRATAVGFAANNMLVVGQPSALLIVDRQTGEIDNHWNLTVNDLIAVDSTRFVVATASDGLLMLDTDAQKLHLLSTLNPAKNQSWTLVRKIADNLVGVSGSMGAFLVDIASFSPETNNVHFYDIPLRPYGLGQTIRDFRLVGDNLWLSTGNGVVQVPLDVLLHINLVPNINISRLFVDEVEMNPDRTVQLNNTINQLRIELSNTGYQNADRYVLEFRQNTDKDNWIELSQPSVLLAQLPINKSQYDFRFRDLLTGGVPAATTLEVYKQPIWWQTVSGLILIAVAFISLGIVVTYSVQKKVQKRKVAAFERADKIRKLERVAVTQLLTSHYVFNALTTIRSLMRKSADDAIDYIGKFAQVIRVLVDQSFEIDIDLESELRWIDDYLSLEATNRGIELNYTIHSDEQIKLYDVAIPSFTLQPIFENALTHGKSQDRKLEIHCEISKTGDVLEITISNSMRGVKLSAGHHDLVREKGSVGLKLMQDRLRNWIAFHNLGHDSNMLRFGAENDKWVTRLRLPYIPYE